MTEEHFAKWKVPDIDKSARLAVEIQDYIEKLEAIAALARQAAEDVVKRGEIVKKWGRMFYKGVARVEAFVEHSNGRLIITAKYGDRTTTVELEGMERFAILANLAAIAIRDDPNFYLGYVLHRAISAIQATDRLLMWGALMPGKYAIDVEHVYTSTDALSPLFSTRSLFGHGGGRRIITSSTIHRTIFRAAIGLGGPDGDRVLVIAWLFISAIFNTPEGGKPSEGLAELAKRLAAKGGRSEEEYKTAFEPLRPYLEDLDKLLGPISRGDKAFLAAKMADYGGRVIGDWAIIPIDNIKMKIVLNGVEIDMTDIADAAAKAFSEMGGLHKHLVFAGILPVKGPAIKAAAMERELKELIKYGKLINIGDIIEVTPIETKEVVVRITPENFEEVLIGFKSLYYTHLRLIINGKKYDFFCRKMNYRDEKKYYSKLVFAANAMAELEEIFGTRRDKRIEFGIKRMKELAMIYEAYAVRRAKMGEAMWHVKIKYKGVTIELRMSHIANQRYFIKRGKIDVVVDGKLVEIDPTDIRDGRGIGGIIAEALNAAGVKWYANDRYLYMALKRSR